MRPLEEILTDCNAARQMTLRDEAGNVLRDQIVEFDIPALCEAVRERDTRILQFRVAIQRCIDADNAIAAGQDEADSDWDQAFGELCALLHSTDQKTEQ